MLKKINLGCGPVGKDDWINIDWGILSFLHKFILIERLLLRFKLFPRGYNVEWPKNLMLHDCRKKIPLADSSVDYIYTSHFLEHFKKFECERILKDCYRLLRKGGIMRIAVPDLEILVGKYLSKDKGYFRKLYSLMNFGEDKPLLQEDLLLADILMDNFYPSFYKNEPLGINKLLAFFVRPHFWMYDYGSLELLLKMAGFVKIGKKAFRDGRVPDLDCLDVFPEMSLYVEAEK